LDARLEDAAEAVRQAEVHCDVECGRAGDLRRGEMGNALPYPLRWSAARHRCHDLRARRGMGQPEHGTAHAPAGAVHEKPQGTVDRVHPLRLRAVRDGDKARSQYSDGGGVPAPRTGSIGYSMRGCSPVRVSRKATMSSTSSAVSWVPSCAVPITSTASCRVHTWPVWKYGAVSATLRSGAARNTYSSVAVRVTSKRPLSPGGSNSAPGRETSPNGK